MVGIGASAGGLEALESLFAHVPPELPAAFVVFQHLSPDYESMLAVLLQRGTPLPVSQITDGTRIEPQQVYVNPPDREVMLRGGVLRLLEPLEAQGIRHSIDYFFRSLAEDQGEMAVGIILSGAGNDGTEGMEAILRAGGLTVVQDPSTARYSSMPQSAAYSGYADFLLPPEEIPELLVNFANDPGSVRLAPRLNREVDTDALLPALELVKRETGLDFSNYKEPTLLRRIERRIRTHGLPGVNQYLRLLKHQPPEAHALARDFLIPVTRFFRDPVAFEALERHVVPKLLGQASTLRVLRIWVPGCSTGEEAYSLAMLFKEHMDKHRCPARLQVFATDLSPEAIDTARHGVYPKDIAEDVSPARLDRYFMPTENGFQVRDEIRTCMVFSVQDVLTEPPFSHVHLISCRNLLIYVKSELHRQLFETFHFSLNPGGYLLLSTSESVGISVDLFTSVDREAKLHQRRGVTGRTGLPMRLLARGERPRPLPPSVKRAEPPEPSVGEFIDRLVQKLFAPPWVVLNEDLEVIRFGRDTHRYLHTPEGDATTAVLRLLPTSLVRPVKEALEQARVSTEDVVVPGPVEEGEDGVRRQLKLLVRPLVHPDALRGKFLLVFETKPLPPRSPEAAAATVEVEAGTEQRVAELEWELEVTRQHLHGVIQELETAYMESRTGAEELQSVNEEMESTNEELQSANEELQSTNEEMQSLNAELQNSLEQMANLNDDLANLLRNTEIGTLFLDQELRVRRFTPSIAPIVRLAESDVGRPIAELSINLDPPDVLAHVRRVLDTLERHEAEVRDLDGRWYLMRIAPYRTASDQVIGAVLTFVDIDARKHAEERLLTLTRAIDQSANIVIVTDSSGHIEYVNPKFTEVSGYTLSDVQDRTPRVVKSGTHSTAFYQDLWQSIAAGNVWRGELQNRGKNGQSYWVSAVISPVTDKTGETTHFVAVQEETTERRELENTLRASEALHRETLASISDAVFVTDDYGRFTYICPNVDVIFGRSVDETRALGNIRGLVGDGLFDRALLAEQGEVRGIERGIVDARGQTHVLLFNVKSVDIDGGTTLYSCRDVTERQQAEQRRRHSEEAYFLALGLAHVGSWDWDIASGELRWSEAAKSVFGFFRGGLGGTYAAFLDCVHPDDRAMVEEAIEACIKGRRELAIEHRICWPDGSVHRVSEKGGVVRDETGKAVRMLGVVEIGEGPPS